MVQRHVSNVHHRDPDDDLTPWLSLVLDSTGSSRLVSHEVVQSLWSGYGQILRCRVEGGSCGSVIVKHVKWPSSNNHTRGWNSSISHKRKVRSYQVEGAWYAQHAARCSLQCRVPTCLAHDVIGDQVVMVLEDLDEAGFGARRSQVTDTELRACLTWLASFHATFMGITPEGLWETGTYWHLETRPEELEALTDMALKRAAPEIDRKLNATKFQTFVHGDAKLANFCFFPDGERVAAVDFQYVGGGCGTKDLVYFVSSCFDESQCQAREAEILELYFGLLRQALDCSSQQLDLDELESDWRALYPIAWTDFYRFLKGWSPGHWKLHRYSERLAREVLASL